MGEVNAKIKIILLRQCITSIRYLLEKIEKELDAAVIRHSN